MIDSPLSPAEEAVMRSTFKATMLRAADIIERLTEFDLSEAQRMMLAQGVSLERVARMDRLDLAVAHLRACAITMASAHKEVAMLGATVAELRRRVK